jgi:hypothetical protein
MDRDGRGSMDRKELAVAMMKYGMIRQKWLFSWRPWILMTVETLMRTSSLILEQVCFLVYKGVSQDPSWIETYLILCHVPGWSDSVWEISLSPTSGISRTPFGDPYIQITIPLSSTYTPVSRHGLHELVNPSPSPTSSMTFSSKQGTSTVEPKFSLTGSS